jgi:pimeloyl-ACP methyl ester carboxylesterase
MTPMTRRLTLTGIAAGSAAAISGTAISGTPAAAGPPARRRRVTTVVMVAGASGTATGDAELVLRGHRALGVTLPGHSPEDGQFQRAYQAPQDLAALATAPSPMRGITLDDYVRRCTEVVRRAARNGPVVLWGGSMGGATLSRVGNEVPHLIDRIVYSSAFCCVDLPSCGDYLVTPEAADSMLMSLAAVGIGDPAVIGASRANWRTADPTILALLKEALVADATDAEFLAMLNTFEPDESAQVPLDDARGHARTWGRIPRTYIRHTRDRCIPPALQDRMIAEADRLTPHNRFDVRSLPTSRAPDSAGWAATIDIIDALAAQVAA